ncbi:MAG: 30S ribosomal protein S3 [Candidatus Cardinium sp.]|uniref:Small ribosomal subunit protein uS3 n=1 Tax=Candidatus Cardinium hertigii TaxID=247481 RepID=A0A2Z3L7Z7_9BACT|nr:30S ribosomal protein S3 [Candidatus Cardinium hertigii]AWN81758.1 30S ribosomal protein S3 [Candidatus Cardinium hertigii]MDD9139596.1 30S ribosomal protein S3 [Candidatus Cardinium sp.]
MGQKVHPIGFRLGFIRKPDASWFSSKKDYADNLMEDHKIRMYLDVRLARASVAKVLIERAGKKITITIHTARPGSVIGKSGTEVDKLKEALKQLTNKEVEVNIVEIKRLDLEAKLVATQIAQQVRGRLPFKRVVKQTIAAVMRSGAEGVKIKIAGRLDGAEMARSEQFREGAVPLHTLRNDIDYAIVEAHTIYGRIGIKVWIARGEVTLPVAGPLISSVDRIKPGKVLPAKA